MVDQLWYHVIEFLFVVKTQDRKLLSTYVVYLVKALPRQENFLRIAITCMYIKLGYQ